MLKIWKSQQTFVILQHIYKSNVKPKTIKLMKQHFTTNIFLLKTLMIVAMLVTSMNTVLADDDPVTVGDVSNTDCASRTRAAGVMGHPILKMTRFENGFYAELTDFEVNCAYGNINVVCQEDGNNLSINVDEGLVGGIVATCNCPINICFTIFNAQKDEYQLIIDGRNIGVVSFKEHSVVEIDLWTLEQAYDESFEYPVMAQNFKTYEVNYNQNSSKHLDIYPYYDHQLKCIYYNFALPCEYSMLDVQANIDQDGTLVINTLTDGIPGQSCKRMANLNFNIVNITKDSYHLKLNHTIQAKVNGGQERTCTVCLYEGDITIQDEMISIPITDNYDYLAILSGIELQDITGRNSDAPIYNLQGQHILTPQRGGLYIKNGRKFVAP